MTQPTFKSANRRYFRAFVPIMALYLLILMAGKFYLNSLTAEPQALQVAIALLAALPMAAFIGIELRFIAETDEYTRAIRYKAIAFAAGILVTAIFTIGFLQLFDAMGAIDVFWFGPAFFGLYGLSSVYLGGKAGL